MKVFHVATGALLAAGLSFSAAHAEMVKYKATLAGSQEVPANDTKGKGTAEITVDTTAKKLMFTVNFEGLSGDATAAHIHGPADAGANAGVAINLGTIGGTKSPITGESPLTDAQIADIAAGKTYVNVHTAANKGGEIRGQITK